VLLRSTAHLLVVVMLLAQGRLLACGWECIDEVAATVTEASCHDEPGTESGGQPTIAMAMVGEAAHVCLPEVTEPTVTVAKTFKAQMLAAAPSVARFVMPDPSDGLRQHRLPASRFRLASPHTQAPPVLRI